MLTFQNCWHIVVNSCWVNSWFINCFFVSVLILAPPWHSSFSIAVSFMGIGGMPRGLHGLQPLSQGYPDAPDKWREQKKITAQGLPPFLEPPFYFGLLFLPPPLYTSPPHPLGAQPWLQRILCFSVMLTVPLISLWLPWSLWVDGEGSHSSGSFSCWDLEAL